MPYIVTSECILCGACVVGCESDAITEGDTQSYINPDLCVECGTCERNCPSEAIIYVEESDAVLSSPPDSAQESILNSSPGT